MFSLSKTLQKTESQNHRMVGVGRALCGSSSPTLLLKQGHLQQAAQDLVQAGLEYLQRRRTIKPAGNKSKAEAISVKKKNQKKEKENSPCSNLPLTSAQ